MECPERYFVATYFLQSKTNLFDATWAIAIGQSIGNPNIRSPLESTELIKNHSARILADPQELRSLTSGVVKIAYPNSNIDFTTDGIAQLLCQVMGGNLDIDIIEQCHLLDISIPEDNFLRPQYGLSGLRKLTQNNSVLLGAIVKPKTGLNINQLKMLVGDMIDGGANFIKEDEILSSPYYMPLETRVHEISKLIENTNVIYSFCINSIPDVLLKRAQLVADLGGNSIHINVWSGLGAYQSIRALNLPLFIHFQKSGDRIFTNKSHNYHIRWLVICKIAALMGVDSIHAGMIGGYSPDDEFDILECINLLKTYNVVSSLSCGMKPELIKPIYDKIGSDWMATSGGWIHGHNNGTKAGLRCMKDAIEQL